MGLLELGRVRTAIRTRCDGPYRHRPRVPRSGCSRGIVFVGLASGSNFPPGELHGNDGEQPRETELQRPLG